MEVATRQKSYDRVESAFKERMLPHEDALKKGGFNRLYEFNTGFLKAVNELIDSAINEGRLGDAKAVMGEAAHVDQGLFGDIVEMRKRIMEGSIRNAKFSSVKPLPTG